MRVAALSALAFAANTHAFSVRVRDGDNAPLSPACDAAFSAFEAAFPCVNSTEEYTADRLACICSQTFVDQLEDLVTPCLSDNVLGYIQDAASRTILQCKNHLNIVLITATATSGWTPTSTSASTGNGGGASYTALALPPMNPDTVVTAIAVLRPTEGSNVTGTLTLRQDPTQDPPLVILTVSIENAPPNSKHGFHLHQFGDTSSPKGLAQFDHFNPFNHTHGCPTPNPDDTPSPLAISLLHHVGDMGSIATDARGRATASWSSTQLSLVDPTHAGYIPGRGVIFHADADDCVTQPTGASGKRLAQGVVAFQSGGGVDNVIAKGRFAEMPSEDAIAVFQKKSLTGTVAFSMNVDSPKGLVVTYNVTGLKIGRTYRVSVGLPPTSPIPTAKDCKTLSTFTTDTDGQSKGTFAINSMPEMPLQQLFGMTLKVTTENCIGDPFVGTTPVGTLNATAFQLLLAAEAKSKGWWWR